MTRVPEKPEGSDSSDAGGEMLSGGSAKASVGNESTAFVSTPLDLTTNKLKKIISPTKDVEYWAENSSNSWTRAVLRSGLRDHLTRVDLNKPIGQSLLSGSSSVFATPERTLIEVFSTDSSLLDSYKKLDNEVSTLHRTLESQARELKAALHTRERDLKEARVANDDLTSKLREVEKTKEELEEKQRLAYVLSRISPTTHKRLFEDDVFQKEFLNQEPRNSFVMSVDIRRSTELMLKARSPMMFAEFVTVLCERLMQSVLHYGGIFDKFTGDGVLAFFPDFYSGSDAGFRVIAAADDCHRIFSEHYHSHRRYFKSILADVGLGIGIDFGSVQMVNIAGGLTVVGEPVVYACRLSNAPPHSTLANQPAYEEIGEKFGAFCTFQETELDIKHEGPMLAYKVTLNGRTYELGQLPWADPQTDIKE